jgi:hypothetical protein
MESIAAKPAQTKAKTYEETMQDEQSDAIEKPAWMRREDFCGSRVARINGMGRASSPLD